MLSYISLLLCLPIYALSHPNPSDPLVPFYCLRCPSCNTTLLPTPTYNLTSAVFTVCSKLIIHAPLPEIYFVLLDFSNYHLWNTFVIAVDVPSNITKPEDVYVGMPMNLTTQGLIPDVNTTSSESITILDLERRHAIVAWGSISGANDTLLEAEHPSILTDLGDGKTRYVSYETYYGPAALGVEALEGNLVREFWREGWDLKGYVEAMG